jgi:hypothetical protein
VFEEVDALEDAKGYLRVHWRRRPTGEGCLVFSRAWADVGEETTHAVEHLVPRAKRGPQVRLFFHHRGRSAKLSD